MAAIKTVVWVLVSGYIFYLGLKVVVGCFIFSSLVMLSQSWVVQLWRLFIQYHCHMLGTCPIDRVYLCMRVSHYVSCNWGERWTDPVGVQLLLWWFGILKHKDKYKKKKPKKQNSEENIFILFLLYFGLWLSIWQFLVRGLIWAFFLLWFLMFLLFLCCYFSFISSPFLEPSVKFC